jgi:hypothetical protein
MKNNINELKVGSEIISHGSFVAWVYDKSPYYNRYKYSPSTSKEVWTVKYINVDYIIIDFNNIILNYE